MRQRRVGDLVPAGTVSSISKRFRCLRLRDRLAVLTVHRERNLTDDKPERLACRSVKHFEADVRVLGREYDVSQQDP